ncbi:MAG TPA: HNH endonuclease signature motif containing protein, partial [Acidimicrobiales bacterium]|nr:HNH endonuclease signature motif containing protein [Acidimicrobiales bacterium]
GRQPTQMQRTALAVRDSCCIVPRCGRTQRLETHHVPDFEKSRHTVLDELALLCPQHHDDVTYHGAKLSGGPGNWQWIPPPPTREFEGPPEGIDPCAGPFDDNLAAAGRSP